jgi:hypothetical protein
MISTKISWLCCTNFWSPCSTIIWSRSSSYALTPNNTWVSLLARLTGKRLCIGVRFGHTILAQSWPRVVWVTSRVLCVHLMDGHVL